MGPAEHKHLTTLETNPARLISRPKGRTRGVGIVLTRDDHDADRGIRHLIRPPRIPVSELVDNDPVVLMVGETFIHENLRKARVTPDDLRAKLREANVLNYAQVATPCSNRPATRASSTVKQNSNRASIATPSAPTSSPG